MRGPKPKALEQQRREGNPSKKAEAELESVIVGERLEPEDEVELAKEMPAHLEAIDLLDENDESVGHALWAALIEWGVEARLLTSGDLLQLSVIVESELIARRCLDELRDHGMLIVGDRGTVRNPAFTTWRDARAQQLRVCEHYGLTPSARARLGLAGLKGKALEKELDKGLPPSSRQPRGDEEVAQGGTRDSGDESQGAGGRASSGEPT